MMTALLLSSGCAPFVDSAVLQLSAARGRLKAMPLQGLALGPARLGGQGPRFRLDTDALGIGMGLSATCDDPDEDPRPLIANLGCAAGGHSFGTGGLGTAGGGYGGGGGGMGRRAGRPHPAQPLLRQDDSQRSQRIETSPWAWAVIDLPYRQGPPAHFDARPEAKVSTQTLVQQHELSTFGVDVDTAAYSIARRALLSGSRPEPTLVRPEEMLNAFSYRYPEPRGLIGVSTDGARSPYEPDRFLLRVGLQAKTVQSERRAPVNLVFLIDTSCSMAGSDRLDLVKDSVQIALEALQPGDEVAITTYAGSTQVVLPPTAAQDMHSVQDALSRLTAAGGTGMATGLELAYQQAAAMHNPGDHSHVVVCSDGDANIGPSNADDLLAAISDHARKGIALSTIGFGTGNYRDRVMERLANEGDGSYAYVDAPRQARAVFGTELLRTLQNVARDVKIQVALNSSAVKAWRLVGYENRALKAHEFMDDSVDAGDVGSGHQVTALYELTLQPGAEGQLGEVRIRAQPFEGGAVETVTHAVHVRTIAHPFEHASADLRWATAVLGFAELLRHSPYASALRTQDILQVALGAHPEQDPDRAELIALLEAMQRMGLSAAHPARPSQTLSAVGVTATRSSPSPG